MTTWRDTSNSAENLSRVMEQRRALKIEEQEARRDLARITEEMSELAAKDEIDAGETKRFERLNRGSMKAEERIADIQLRLKSLDVLATEEALAGIRSGALDSKPGDFGLRVDSFDRDPGRDAGDIYRPKRSADPWRNLEGTSLFRGLSTDETRSRAHDAIGYASGTTNAAREEMAKAIDEFDTVDARLSRWILETSSPDYTSAYWAYLRGDGQLLTDAEIQATRRVKALQRAMSLTDSEGGYAVPAQLDPTFYITGAGSQSDIARISRNVVATGDVWSGVSAAQISASWDGEAAEVSDDSPTLAQPSVSVHKSQVFVPYSIEVGMDAANFSQEVTRMMADAQANLEATAFATGTGSSQPFGIVTALTGGASEVPSITTDTFAIGDVYALFDALPARHKANGVWLANDAIYSLIRQFDTTGGAGLWTYLADENPARLIGRPAASSSAMDGTVTAAAENYLAVFGAFLEAYVIARRIGFQVELVPHLFATGNNRPSGQRGLYGYSRLGADSIADDSFRMLNVT